MNFDDPAVQYLLNLPGSDRSAIESRLFSDDNFTETIESAERELLDLYARNQLSPDFRTLVESELLTTPQQHEKLRFSEMLARKLQRPSSARTFRGATLIGIAAGLLIAALGVVWWHHGNGLTTPLQSANMQDRRAPKPQNVVSFLLMPGVLRGSQLATLNVPANADVVRLELAEVPANPNSSVELRDANGQIVWQQDHLSLETNGAAVSIGRRLLRSGSYKLTIKSELPAIYSFRVQ